MQRVSWIFFFFFFFFFSFYVHIFTVILHSWNDLGLIYSHIFLLAFFFLPFPSFFLFCYTTLPFCISKSRLTLSIPVDGPCQIFVEGDQHGAIGLFGPTTFPILGNVLEKEKWLGKGRKTDGRQKKGGRLSQEGRQDARPWYIANLSHLFVNRTISIDGSFII